MSRIGLEPAGFRLCLSRLHPHLLGRSLSRTDVIRFGTDGWRDVIADNFTYANVVLVAAAHASHLISKNGSDVVLGHDTRFQGEGFADVVAQTMTAAGLRVHRAPAFIPTPAVSFAVRFLGAAGGVMLTASHNKSF